MRRAAIAIGIFLLLVAGGAWAHNDEGNPYYSMYHDGVSQEQKDILIRVACDTKDHRIVHTMIDNANKRLNYYQSLLEEINDPKLGGKYEDAENVIKQERDTKYFLSVQLVKRFNKTCGLTDTHTLPEKRKQ